MPKAIKIVVIDALTQVYPADEGEDIWHVWHNGRPVVEVQFASAPVAVDAVCPAVIQDHFDYIVFGPPPGHEQVFEDRRTKVPEPELPTERSHLRPDGEVWGGPEDFGGSDYHDPFPAGRSNE